MALCSASYVHVIFTCKTVDNVSSLNKFEMTLQVVFEYNVGFSFRDCLFGIPFRNSAPTIPNSLLVLDRPNVENIEKVGRLNENQKL